MLKYLTVFSLVLIAHYGQCQKLTIDSLSSLMIDLGEVSDYEKELKGTSELKNILKDVEIVMLGEQSHGEATAYETKIKLIEYLHQELGFDLLLFESGFYDCHKAWELIESGEDVRSSMGRSIFSIWLTMKDLKPLSVYIDSHKNSENPLKLLGFDSQITGKVSQAYLVDDLTHFINLTNPELTASQEWDHLKTNLTHLVNFDFKKLKKNDPNLDVEFMDKIIQVVSKSENVTDYWLQVLKNIRVYLSDVGLKTDGRDQQMAANLIWIKEKYPDSKIICWGATSHFLYNSKEIRMKSPVVQIVAGNYYKKVNMMGEYVKSHYKEKAYTIGFTAYEGHYGTWRRKKLKTPKKKSLELLLGEAKYDNFLLPLAGLDFAEFTSRPLGNLYMKTPINRVMDAVIFNRKMTSPTLDRNFFLKINPENKYIKPEPIEEGEAIEASTSAIH